MPERTARKLSPGLMDGKLLAIFGDARAFVSTLPEQGSLLGLDVSPRRIGLAGTDAGRRLVTPLRTWLRRRLEDDIAEIARIAGQREAAAIVVGWPLEMDGSRGPACDRVRAFAGRLSRRLSLPILLQDERLTTAAMREALLEGRYPSPKVGAHADHLAAAVILEDALRSMSRPP